jgi:hypothetical protein
MNQTTLAPLSVSSRTATFLRTFQLSSAVTVQDDGMTVAAPAFVAAALLTRASAAPQSLLLAQLDVRGRLITTSAVQITSDNADLWRTTAKRIHEVLDPRAHGVIAATLGPTEGEAGAWVAAELSRCLDAAGVDLVDYVVVSRAVQGSSQRAEGRL